MSHLPERKEKNCLNCEAEVLGRYCQNCGQQNIEPKETVWHLITHFFNDITHFDGKFFSTLKFLVTKPGFLTKEYSKGRRASYLNPVRMYIFTSAIFFIIFFSVYNVKNMDLGSAIDSNDSDTLNWYDKQEWALKNAKTKKDSTKILTSVKKRREKFIEDSLSGKKLDSVAKPAKGIKFSFETSEYTTVAAYDSAQQKLAADKRDGWITRTIKKRQIQINNEYQGNDKEFWKDLLAYFFKQFPKILFFSLPLFALILQLLYIRRKFIYVDHAIFSVNLYIFAFILMLILMGVSALRSYSGWAVFRIIEVIIWVYFLYYIYRAMRVFYQQGTAKTVVKYVLLNFLAFILIIILFIIFFFYSVLQM